jgi:nucleoid DNA-binding protein
MTKKDIVDKVSNRTGIRQVVVKKIVQETFNVIKESLVAGEHIEIRNFGVFKVKIRKPKIGRNPRTGEVVPIKERKVIVFKSGLKVKKEL